MNVTVISKNDPYTSYFISITYIASNQRSLIPVNCLYSSICNQPSKLLYIWKKDLTFTHLQQQKMDILLGVCDYCNNMYTHCFQFLPFIHIYLV